MKEVSNRTLIILFVIAIIATVGGLFAILVKIGFGFGQITGFAASAIGTVNVTVSSTAGISFIGPTNMSFGTGTLYGDGSTTFLNTTSGTMPGGFSKPMDFQLENTGNVPVNISVNGTASTFIGGNSPLWAVNATCAETCNASINTTFPSTKPVNVSATSAMLVNVTNYTADNDLLNISVFLGIPGDVISGTKNATLTFWAVTAV